MSAFWSPTLLCCLPDQLFLALLHLCISCSWVLTESGRERTCNPRQGLSPALDTCHSEERTYLHICSKIATLLECGKASPACTCLPRSPPELPCLFLNLLNKQIGYKPGNWVMVVNMKMNTYEIFSRLYISLFYRHSPASSEKKKCDDKDRVPESDKDFHWSSFIFIFGIKLVIYCIYLIWSWRNRGQLRVRDHKAGKMEL